MVELGESLSISARMGRNVGSNPFTCGNMTVSASDTSSGLPGFVVIADMGLGPTKSREGGDSRRDVMILAGLGLCSWSWLLLERYTSVNSLSE